ncbi:MAG: glycosyltransferase family 4 protein [Pirellulales bacterium]|nr:glycosyltransferase family 4 protein [Pirellulales bacterium]
MRILHLITRLMLGGAQENTVLCCEDLMREHGDEVLLVTGPPGEHEGDLLPRARAGGVPLEVLPALQRQIHPTRDLRAYFDIKRRIKTFRPDVVHTHSAKAGLLGRAAACKLGVPAVVHTVHGAPFHPYQGRGARALFRACERWAARRCHAMISVADAMTDLLVDAGVAPREKFTTIYSGMEIEPYVESARHRQRVRAELGYTAEHFVVGKIARLFHLKGHPFVIEAADRVVQRNPNVRFLLVGGGILREQLEREIASRGLSDYFQFTGLAPRERIPELLSAMDALVHTSLREGLARTLPQALLAGKPVISYDVDGAREVVLPDRTGFLLPPQSIEPLADVILTLATSPEISTRMGEAGRRLCLERFNHHRMTAQIREIYLHLLRGRAGGQAGFTPPGCDCRRPDVGLNFENGVNSAD